MRKLGCVRDPRLRVARAIPVTESRVNGKVYLWSRPLTHFGVGLSFGEAAEDFMLSLRDLYWQMSRCPEEDMGPGLKREWRFMQAYLQKAPRVPRSWQ